jgi:phosphate transport system substrate-binding protein
MKSIARIAAGLSFAVAALPAAAQNITGAGATFPAPVYAKWAEVYRERTGVRLNYQAIGSGGGLKQINARTVDFGASDDPVAGAALEKSGLVQFPAVIGGVVPVVNLKGIQPGQMKLDGPVLADIYRGAITRWNDPAIVRLNPGLPLPASAIALIYRSDSSGTTAVFTDYLAGMSAPFRDDPGAGKTVNWPVGLGGRGNAGVAAYVGRIAGSIGYVEFAFAKQTRMIHVAMLDRGGNVVQPSESSFAAAASGADWDSAPGFGISLNDQAAPGAWPITAASFILMHREPKDPQRAAEVLRFFRWALNEGGALASEVGLVPLPEGLVKKIEGAWRQIRDPSGRPVLNEPA